ncbi:hypothetical protein BX600DRAFT_473173 [Xylariales sp. PMI_506]|nr:hypothetical protein BX600DRAFT_473173 [Xylariales sp. PMI_506]
MASSEQTMKALQIDRPAADAPTTLSLVTSSVPTPRSGLALVKIQYAAIQPSDKLNAKGGFPKTVFPRTPGRDYSGTVVAVDASSDLGSWVSKEIYGTGDSQLGFTLDGSHAQFTLLPEAMLVEKPASLSLVQAASLGVPFTTSLRCLRRARTTPSDTVLVLGGTGAVGSAAVQIAKAWGCRVLSAARRKTDSPDVILPGPDAQETLEMQIASLTDGKGVDVVVDTVGNIGLMSDVIKQLAVRGRYTWIAAPRDGNSTVLPLDSFLAYRNEIELIGVNSVLRTPAEVAEELKELNALFDSGKLEAPAEAGIQKVGLTEAIEKGYNGAKSSKHVVIDLSG